MQKVRKAIIPCAGFGTRFLPATKAIPKEMLPIVDTPTLQYIVDEVVKSGITEILIVINANKKCIEDHFDRSHELESLLEKAGKKDMLDMIKKISDKAHFTYVRQKEMNGSANAILEGEAFVGNEPFAVLYGDDLVYTGDNIPATKQLCDAYEKTGKIIVGCQTVPKQEAPKYGVVAPGQIKGRYAEIKGFVEKPPIDKLPSQLASLGRYVLTPDIFEVIRKEVKPKNGEKYLTDAIEYLARTTGAYAYDFEGRRYDIGDKNGFLEAIVDFALMDKNIAPKFKEYLKNTVSKF